MLHTHEIHKHLILDKNNPSGGSLFVGKEVATKEEIEKLIRVDNAYFRNYGEHYINNYEELQPKNEKSSDDDGNPKHD